MKMAPAPTPASALASHHHHHHHHGSNHQQFQVTEDTPVDYLEGCMEVLVVFPNEKSIPMSIQRRMPMLDLLIHVTAANKLSPAGHLLQVTDEEGRVLPQKPSTPIGSLNAHKVYIVPKNRLSSGSSKSDRFAGTRPSYQAKTVTHFEPTFRVQVRLPRNQLFVTRVTARTQLADLLHTVCNEKDLDPSHYEFRHPVNQDEVLRLNATLDDYKITEVVLVHVPIVQNASSHRHQHREHAPPPADQLTVHDLPAMSNKSKTQAAHTNSAMPGSAPSRGKTGLRSTTSEASLNHAAENNKKKRGLLGLLGFGKHKKGSSMGDSSVSSDSVGDRSISPTRSDEPPPEPPPPATPRPPSPVLVSKRLAEEAVAKRNSRLLMNQKSAEALGIVQPPTPEEPATRAANGSVKAPARAGGKKRMAPAPPVASSSPAPSGKVNGTAKAESEVSTYTTCSSGSSGVSPPASVIDNTSIRDTTPSPNPSQKRPLSTPNYATRPVSHEGSPVRGHSSGNLLNASPVPPTNLTAVSSTSNASLSSSVKKRKAPAPPPVVKETRPEVPEVREACKTNGHDSDATSGVSEESASGVSAVSSTKAENAAEQPASRKVSSASSSSRVASPESGLESEAPGRVEPPKPVPRTRKIQETNKRRDSNSSTSTIQNSGEQISGDDLSLDDEALNMFTLKTEAQVHQVDTQELIMQQQLEIVSRQKDELQLLKENTPVEQPMPRKRWNIIPDSAIPPEITLEWSSSSEDEEPVRRVSDSKLLVVPSERSRANSIDTEFYSLSEEEENQVNKEQSRESPILWQPRLSDGSVRSDPDGEFAAMCEALALKRQQTAPGETLPSDLSQVPVELLQSLPGPPSESFDEDELSPRSRKRVWRRSNSDPGWTFEDDSIAHSPSARSIDNLEELSVSTGAYYSALNDTPFTSTLSNRGDHAGFVKEAPLPWQQDVESLRSSSPEHGTHSDDDYDVVKPHNQNANQTDEEKRDANEEEPRLSKAEPVEERVESEAIYSMVVKKSTQSVKVVDLHEEASCDSSKELVNQVESINEPTDKVVSDVIKVDEEPEVQRAPDERAESPVLWEDKLPAPPTPFADNGEGLPVVEKPSIKSESDRSRSSSISADSLQEVEIPELVDPIPSPTIQQVITTAVIESDDKVTLEHGNELMGESLTEESTVEEQTVEKIETTERIPSPVSLKEQPIEETIADGSLPSIIPPLPLTSPPDVPSEEEIIIAEPIEPPQIFQEEKQEVRSRSNSHSSSVSSHSSHSESKSVPVTSDVGEANETKSPSPEPVVKTDAIVNQPHTPGNVGVNAVPAFLPLMNVDLIQQFQAALTTISDPQARALQEEFLRLQQQFLTWQLHAAGVQLQQPTLVSQPVVEQTVQSAAAQSPVVAEDKQDETPVAQSPLVERDQTVERSQIEVSEVVEVIAQMEAPVDKEKPSDESSLKMETPVVNQKLSDESSSQIETQVTKEKLYVFSMTQTPEPLDKEKPSDDVSSQTEVLAETEKSKSSGESSDEAEEPIYRYAGPPQVKLDTWKPGRPRSEVIDYSSTPSFNIPTFNAPSTEPKSNVESKISTFSMGTSLQSVSRPPSTTPTVTAAPAASAAPVTAPKISIVHKADPERKDVKSPSPEIADSHPEIPVSQEKRDNAKKEDIAKAEPKKEPEIREATKDENDDADVSTGVKDKVGKFESNIDKTVVLRKSSFVTARPFEPRPVSMPIKRPTFAPAVIQPGPFVSRKIQRAPEVRGFASLPSPEQPAKTIASGEPGPVPFGTKPRPVSIVNKENQTIVIRNKLLESARRPSAELDTPPLQTEVNEETRDSQSTQVEEKRPTLAPRPVTMPVSSSLILAASAESSPKKESSVPANPPPPPVMSAPATPAKRSVPSRFERKPDPREELLSSIRNFGANGGTLRKVSH